MSWFCTVLVIFFVLDALRLRRRLASFKEITVTSDSEQERASRDYRFIIAPGIVVDAATMRSAAAFAQAKDLEVLDLVPSDLPSLSAMELLRVFDPVCFRTNCFGRGCTAGHALLATNDVLERADATHLTTPSDAVAFTHLAVRLKRYACRTTDRAIVPRLQTAKENLDSRLAVLFEARGRLALVELVIQPIVMTLLGFALFKAPMWGLMALAAYHLQPLITLGKQRLHPSDLFLVTLGRAPIELWRWLWTVCGKRRPVREAPEIVEARRLEYVALLAGGVERFFEPRRDTCPLCGSSDLKLRVNTLDLYQHKPGRFCLEQCEHCHHIFQNPLLSLAGLHFYYKDFYDGLGQETFEIVFGGMMIAYLARARLLAGRMEPRRWLDVGAGYGHFCCAAREVWPQTTFDGLDFSASIDEAAYRRWINTSYRGLFPEVAPQLTVTYDVVSMFNYLEHARDPQAELEAARQVLTGNGYLLIEVPDPDCCMSRLLGRFWAQWAQPQHLHFLSVINLEKLLYQHGFEPVIWQRGEAHGSLDICFAVFFLLNLLALGPYSPWQNSPWQPPLSRWQRLNSILIWSVGSPLLLLGFALDMLLLPLFRRPGFANVYRVLAQRRRDDIG